MESTERRKQKNLSQISLEIDTDTYFKFKEKSLKKRKSMSELVRNFIEIEINDDKK